MNAAGERKTKCDKDLATLVTTRQQAMDAEAKQLAELEAAIRHQEQCVKQFEEDRASADQTSDPGSHGLRGMLNAATMGRRFTSVTIYPSAKASTNFSGSPWVRVTSTQTRPTVPFPTPLHGHTQSRSRGRRTLPSVSVLIRSSSGLQRLKSCCCCCSWFGFCAFSASPSSSTTAASGRPLTTLSWSMALTRVC